MSLPCRNCSNDAEQGIWKPTKLFNSVMVLCATCQETMHHSRFDDEMKQNWLDVTGEAPESICTKCVKGMTMKGEIKLSIC